MLCGLNNCGIEIELNTSSGSEGSCTGLIIKWGGGDETAAPSEIRPSEVCWCLEAGVCRGGSIDGVEISVGL